VLLDLGSAESRVVDPVAIEHLSEAAEVASDPLIRARACRRLGFVLILSGRLPEVEATYDRAIAAAEGAEPDFALEVEAELISAAQMGMMPPRMLPERFARFDRDKITGDTAGERMLLGVLAFEAVRRNEPAEVAARLAERALRGRPVAAEALLESGPQSLAWLTLMYCDQIELADRIVTEARDLAIRSGSRRGYLVFSMFRSFLAFRLGELQECEELATEATRIDGLHEHGLRLMGASAAIRARVESGDLDGADELLEMIGVKDQPADEVFLEETVYARSLLRQARGEMRRALDDLLAVGRRMLAAGSVGAGVYEWRSKAALMYAALGEHERALEMADEELRLAREFGTPRVVGLALRAAGLLRTGEERIALLQEAVDVLAESPARLEHARALVDLGAMLRRGGRRSDAREVLVRGRMLAFESGATPLANHATDELKATGARPRRVVLSGNAALTPSQRRIASLAASGLSNPEIAQALFVSRKTVEMHLSHAYRTLGISSREELESALAQA
jgi:DNA-binding CsgD family transcriptional regulator